MKKLSPKFVKIALIATTIFVYAPLSLQSQLLHEKEGYDKYDTLMGTVSELRDYDVKHYAINIRFEIEEKNIQGNSTMTFVPSHDMDVMQLDLFSQYDVKSIMLDGTAVQYNRDGNFIFLKTNNRLKKGHKYSINTVYEGKPTVAIKPPWDAGIVWSKDNNDNHWVGMTCEGLGASSWWPCKDHWSDEPDDGVDISFTVPAGYTAVANGKLVGGAEGKEWSVFNWKVVNPINLYNVTVNIAKYAKFTHQYKSKVIDETLDITYWVLPENLEKAKEQFKQVDEMLECFESKFGPYPFYEDGYQLVETPYLGMEHQSCIAYGNKYKQGYLGNLLYTNGHKFDYIIIHESGHEWFGNNITGSDNADMWIHEAYTTYSESIFVECREGKDEAMKYVAAMQRRIGNKTNVVGPYGVAESGSGDMYAKGAVFLQVLRSQVDNDELWFRYLKDINKVFRHKTVSYNEIVMYTNKFFKQDYSHLFFQYLKTTKIPKLEIKEEVLANGNYKYDISLSNLIDGFKSMKVYLDVNGFIKPYELKSSEALRLGGENKLVIKPSLVENYVK